MKPKRFWILGIILAAIAGYALHHRSILKLEREICDLRTTIAESTKNHFVRSIGEQIEAADPDSQPEVSKTGSYSCSSSRYSALTADVIYFDSDAIIPVSILETIAEESPRNPEFLAWKSEGAELGLQRDFRINLKKENEREKLTFLFYESNWPEGTMDPIHQEFRKRNWN
ncbi:hypothetical protein ACFQY0_13815 [Haloferula chungangensis]|uniref:Uncharacterized protein n=1 Tax=Haloferula chungangensis TaxID=1048331 RepID=A0ABW2L782_9BACT